jgi:hypothetical protein
MFFQWKVDMVTYITLTNIMQNMKFKLLDEDWVTTHPLKHSNQPVVTSFHTYDNNNYKKNHNKRMKEKNNNNNHGVPNEYEINLDDYGSDENYKKISMIFQGHSPNSLIKTN